MRAAKQVRRILGHLHAVADVTATQQIVAQGLEPAEVAQMVEAPFPQIRGKGALFDADVLRIVFHGGQPYRYSTPMVGRGFSHFLTTVPSQAMRQVPHSRQPA